MAAYLKQVQVPYALCRRSWTAFPSLPLTMQRQPSFSHRQKLIHTHTHTHTHTLTHTHTHTLTHTHSHTHTHTHRSHFQIQVTYACFYPSQKYRQISVCRGVCTLLT